MLKCYNVFTQLRFELELIFRFNGGHFGFSTSAYVGQHSPKCHWVGYPRKHGRCLWNFDSIMSTSWETCTSGLTAAILNFRLLFTSDSIGTSSTELLDLEIVFSPFLRLFIRKIVTGNFGYKANMSPWDFSNESELTEQLRTHFIKV